MEGVLLEAGLCTSREGQELTDLAFKIDKKIQLSAPTRQLFPRTSLLKPPDCSANLYTKCSNESVHGFLSHRFLLPHEFLRDDNCESCERLAGLFALHVRLTGTKPRKKTPPSAVDPCLHVTIKTFLSDFDILFMSDGSMSG